MKQRILELLKSIVIVVLLCSLLLLVVASLPSESIRSTPWLSSVLQPFGRILNLPQAELSYVETELPVMDAAQPLVISVCNQVGRTSFLWDFQALDAAFGSLGGLLAEGLDTAEGFRTVTDGQIQNAMASTSIFFGYDVRLPVSMLAAWLDVSLADGPEYAHACVLALEDDSVMLYLLDTENVYAAQTRIGTDTVITLLENYRPDGSAFGFEKDSHLHPLSLFPPDTYVIHAASAKNPCTGRFLEQVASGLGFNPYGDASYTNASGDTFYSETNCDLEISADGILTLEADRIPRFRAVGSSSIELVEEARRLLDLALGGCLGDARPYLTEVTRTDAKTICRFSYFLSGIAVESSGADAVVVFDGSYLSHLQARLITYRCDAAVVDLLPPVHAAAILPEGSHLTPAYRDNGFGELAVGWKKSDF